MPEFRLPFIAHGGDYNPDQWLKTPEILEEDVRLMKEARVNLVSVGIFSWAALEPEEGVYRFSWLKDVLDRLNRAGISVLLATPSAARPAWMSQKYPEVLRVENGARNLHGGRENHCFTSPVYRRFVTRINTRLAEEFGAHPAVKGWHISNEYCGECHCELCQSAFREWLKAKYGTISALNDAWWTAFWSKTFSSFHEIHSPEKNGETQLCGLTLDWRRFVNDQTRDFVRCEIAPIRKITPKLPVTINTMGFFYGLNYSSFADTVDFVGYDSYPMWGKGRDFENALETAFTFDLVRGFLNRPWSLMECTPSQVNWHEVCRLKKPGLHLLSSVQAVAHGSDTVMMFQWRKSRGGPEKFHGAVVGHDGSNRTRVFKEVKQVGETLGFLKDIVNAQTRAQVALIFDQENRWALDGAQGPMQKKDYFGVTFDHYKALAQRGVNVDVIDEEKPLDGYKIVAAPYLYMVKPGMSEKLEAFVQNGGTLILSFFCGQTDENDLCFQGGAPGPLKALSGVWAEETDPLYEGQKNRFLVKSDRFRHVQGEYECGFLADILRPEGAEAFAVYGDDWYAGTPAVTYHKMGKGETWYLASRPEARFFNDFYAALFEDCAISPICPRLSPGVIAAEREKDGRRFAFLMNFSEKEARVSLPSGRNLLTDESVEGEAVLPENGFLVIEREA